MKQKMKKFGFVFRPFDSPKHEFMVAEYPSLSQIPSTEIRRGIIYDLEEKKVAKLLSYFYTSATSNKASFWIYIEEDIPKTMIKEHLKKLSALDVGSRKEIKYFFRHDHKIIPKWRRDWSRRIKDIDKKSSCGGTEDAPGRGPGSCKGVLVRIQSGAQKWDATATKK